MRRAVQFTLNGERVEAQVAPHETLVEVLREEFGLYGARESCGQGLCGCCTPGFVLMTRQLLAENPDPSEDDIRHYLSGNLCRCAAYPEIIEAVKLAARKKNSGSG